jgi:hypothetical protein
LLTLFPGSISNLLNSPFLSFFWTTRGQKEKTLLLSLEKRVVPDFSKPIKPILSAGPVAYVSVDFGLCENCDLSVPELLQKPHTRRLSLSRSQLLNHSNFTLHLTNVVDSTVHARHLPEAGPSILGVIIYSSATASVVHHLTRVTVDLRIYVASNHYLGGVR